MQIARPSAACLEATEINWFPSSGHTEPLYDSSTSEQIVTADALAACYHTVEIDQSTSASSVHAAVDETFSAQDCEWIPCDAIIVPSADASTLNMQEQPMQSEDGSVVIGEPNSKKETKKKVRKRVRNDKIWKKNARKTVYNSGQSKRYKGEEQERTVKTCGGCRRKCVEKLSKDDQQTLHREFWAMGDQKRRADFIVNHTERKPIQRRTSGGKKQYSYYYFLPKGDGRTVVCKRFFLGTFGISERMVSYTHDHKQITGISGNRAPRSAPNKTPDLAIQEIRDHIESYPTVDSHYRRKDSNRQYLEQGLSLAMMYRMYVERCNEKHLQPVKECTYRKIFNTEYNLSFHLPTNDQCSWCTEVRIAGMSDEPDDAYAAHIRRKDEVRAAKEQDKIAFEGRIAATFDLQQVLTAPKLNVGAAYYLRKLNVYNLCVYELQTHEGFAYMWNESEGNRRANEIATAVYTWLSAKDEEKFKECILYSDSCGGQNRNKMMSTMIISFLLQSSSVTTVHQKFFEVGHSFMECDSMHSVIERKVKHSEVYGPSDYVSSVRSSCVKNRTMSSCSTTLRSLTGALSTGIFVARMHSMVFHRFTGSRTKRNQVT